MTTKATEPSAPKRVRKTRKEQLAELDEKRKKLEQQSTAVQARCVLESAIAKLRGLDFDGAVEHAVCACRMMQRHVAVPDIDVEEYGAEGSESV